MPPKPIEKKIETPKKEGPPVDPVKESLIEVLKEEPPVALTGTVS